MAEMKFVGHREPTEEERTVYGQDIRVFMFARVWNGEEMVIRVPVKADAVSDDMPMVDMFEIQSAAEAAWQAYRRQTDPLATEWPLVRQDLTYDPDKFRANLDRLRAEAAELGITAKPNSEAVHRARRQRYMASTVWDGTYGDHAVAQREMPELSQRVRNALLRSGIDRRTVVATMTDEELLAIRNLGLSGLVEIRKAIPFDRKANAEAHGYVDPHEYAEMLAVWLNHQGIAA
jgi:Bacterial RNA polymerase, alpha chain C terminal domain